MKAKQYFAYIFFKIIITYLKISLLNTPEVVLVNDLRTISLSVAQDLYFPFSVFALIIEKFIVSDNTEFHTIVSIMYYIKYFKTILENVE